MDQESKKRSAHHQLDFIIDYGSRRLADATIMMIEATYHILRTKQRHSRKEKTRRSEAKTI